jgi:hypothetical protein
MVLLGHAKTVKILKTWKENGCKDPPYFNLVGIPGIGKRSIISHVFNEYEILSFCSETKKKDILEEIQKKITVTTFGDFFEDFKKSLILIEHVDKAIGDAKFYKDLLKIIEKSRYPVLMTCKLKKRIYKNTIDIDPVKNVKIVNFLKDKYSIPLPRIKEIVYNSGGDIRSCMNILNLAEITKNTDGIQSSDSFLISNDAIQNILTHKRGILDNISICTNDFQNISEMLFYNLPHTFKVSKSKKKAVDDLSDLAKLYDNVSFGDTIMKYIHKGHKESLVGHFVTIACLPVINKIHYKKKFKPTKLSVPFAEYSLPRDINSYFFSFKYITVPKLFEENKLVYYANSVPSKELFDKIFRIVFRRSMKKKEKMILNEILLSSN